MVCVSLADMVRVLFIAGTLSLICAVLLGVKPGAWEDANKKAAADVGLMSSLALQPDRVSWRLSEDPALRRALIWNTSGARKYPPPGGLIPLAYELSDDALREITLKQSKVEGDGWSWFDLAETQLLYCSQRPSVCLICV